jgi:hypothetical protein
MSIITESFNDVIYVAEKLYYEANPSTKMDIPSFAYEQVEKANHRRVESKSTMNLYDWCKTELSKNQCQHINAYSFHDNAPMWCPECEQYIDGGKPINENK